MAAMVDQPGFFDLSARLRELSAKGDDLNGSRPCWIWRSSARI